MRKLLLSLLAAAVLFGGAGLCHAQSESKPLVTVSFAGYDKLISDIAMIGKLGGNPNLGKQLEMLMLMLPQGEGSKGPLALDTKQPWGAVVSNQGSMPAIYAFVPVSDIKPMIELAKSQSGQDIKADGDVYQIPVSGKIMFATQKGNWAFIADTKERLAKVDADPASLLGDLPKRYDLAIRASLKNMPAEYRAQLVAQLRAGAEVGMQQQPNESDEEYALRANVAKQGIQQLTTFVNEMDNVLLGWNIDAKSKSTYLDLELTAQPSTKLAEQLAQAKPGKTKFAGLLLPGAAVTLNSVGVLSDNDVAQVKSALATLRKKAGTELESQDLPKDQVKLAQELLGDVIDVLEKTAATKKTDAAMSLMLDPNALTFVAGTSVADGAKLEKTLQKLLDEVKKNEEAAAAVEMKSETYQGVTLHVLSMPTPDAELATMVGDTFELVVGIADDKLLLAAGRDAADTLKKGIDGLASAAGKEVPAMQITLAAKPIAQFVAQVGNDEQTKATASMLAGLLERAGEKDHITLTTSPISQGVRVRLEVEEGLLQVLGSLSQAMGGMTPAGGGGF